MAHLNFENLTTSCRPYLQVNINEVHPLLSLSIKSILEKPKNLKTPKIRKNPKNPNNPKIRKIVIFAKSQKLEKSLKSKNPKFEKSLKSKNP